MTIGKEKLKHCPFCGGEVQLETVKSRAGTLYGVVCRNTGNRGGTCAMEQVPSRTAEAAIARWNMRKPEDELRTDVERLKRELAEMTQYRDNAANHMRRIRAEATAFEKECGQLKAENEVLRKDAERYRWLRSDTVDLEQFNKAAHSAFDGLVDEARAREHRS